MTDIIIKDTHRGLWYEDGILKKTAEAGRYQVPAPFKYQFLNRLFPRPQIEVVLVDIRERDLTIRGQEILTADKVAIRVSIVVQFRVVDPKAAVHQVENYESRLYTDVQLAARRSLASMTLEEILTNRNRLSEDILEDVKEVAANYGVEIFRANVKDLIFPGNLQEIMNKVLAAERMSQVHLVEARTKAEVQRMEAQTRAESNRLDAEAQAESQRMAAQNKAEIQRIKTEADLAELQEREKSARIYAQYPELVRLLELETLRELSKSGNARLYINFDRPDIPSRTDDEGKAERK